MLTTTLAAILSVLVAGSLAQSPPTTTGGLVYSCPTGDQALQAYDTRCPLALNDNTALTSKDINVAYSGSPSSFQTTKNTDVLVRCTYGAANTRSCAYTGGIGTQLNLAAGYNNDAQCPATAANGGADPKPSGGGNFRKRDATEIQMHQTSFVCPIPPADYTYPLKSVTDLYRPNYAQPQTYIQCVYNAGGINNYYYCQYDSNTGAFRSNSYNNQGRCPTTACQSPYYMAQMRKRSIASRQMDPDLLRARAAAPAGAPVPKRRMSTE